jgi:sigma-B regulation protein RsbQ
LKSISPIHALTALCAIFQSDHRADLARVTVPTLLLQSQDDFAVPMFVAEYLHQHIRGSRLKIIQATGHFPHISAPHEMILAMREYISGPQFLIPAESVTAF